MLLPPDANLVRRDSTFPGLATLLDSDAFVRKLRQMLAREDLEAGPITYVKYVPRQKCLVGYQLLVAGTAVPVHAIAYPSETDKMVQKARNRPGIAGPLGTGRFVLEGCASVVSVFPNDRKIKGLAALADADALRGFLCELVPDRPDLRDGTLECLAYKPERRYVARLRGTQQADAVLRLYDTESFPTARGNTQAFLSRGPLKLAQRLAASDAHATLVLEWLPGRVLSEDISDPQFDPEALTNVGAALAELHAQNPEGLPDASSVAMATLRGVPSELSLACPHLAEWGHELAQRLAAGIKDQETITRPIHGDFNASQVLLTGESVAILDFDAAALGDPAIDLGNFAAHLERDVLRGKTSPSQVERVMNGLLAGYRTSGGLLTSARIDLYTAAALFQRFKLLRYWEPHWRGISRTRCWEPHWPGRAEQILGRIEELLRTASFG